jgi:hypothetical protein
MTFSEENKIFVRVLVSGWLVISGANPIAMVWVGNCYTDKPDERSSTKGVWRAVRGKLIRKGKLFIE